MTTPPLRGRIDVFDPPTRIGVIRGPDGTRYRFGAADLMSDAPLAVGQPVTFAPGDDGRARQIQPAEPSIAVFDFGRVARRTFGSLIGHWRLSLVAAVVLAGMPAALSAWGGLHTYDALRIAGFTAYITGTVASEIGLFLLVGALARATINDIRGVETPIGQSLETFGSTALRLSGLSVVSAMGILVGAVFFVIPAIVLSVWWSVCGPALVIEGRGVTDSMKRSIDLTDGYRWRLFAVLLAYYALSWITIQVIYAFVKGIHDWEIQRWAYVGGAVLQAILIRPVTAVATVAIYYELRTIKDGDEPDAVAAVFT